MSEKNISDIYRDKNWRKIVRELKQGYDFGFHGTKSKNLAGILEDADKENPISGHFFCVGKIQKELSDEEFYKKLWKSLETAYTYSEPFGERDGITMICNRPLLVLGVSENVGKRSDYEGSKFFPIEDFFLACKRNEIRVISPSMTEMERINRKSLEQYPVESFDSYSAISRTHFQNREVMRNLMRKLPKYVNYPMKDE